MPTDVCKGVWDLGQVSIYLVCPILGSRPASLTKVMAAAAAQRLSILLAGLTTRRASQARQDLILMHQWLKGWRQCW